MIIGMQEIIETTDELKKEFDARGGLRDIIFVACGGSLASSYPARFLLQEEGKTFNVFGMNSSEFVNAMPKRVGRNCLVIGTSTKATAETVEAIKAAHKAGAVTIGLTGEVGSLTAQAADYSIIYKHSDEWYSQPELVTCNSQGTSLKLAFRILKVFENYEYYSEAENAFEQMPGIYAEAYETVREEGVQFGMRYQNDEVFNVLASGSAWETAYADAFCFFQEMQTVHCVPVNSGEYFHGAFETTDPNLAVILFKSTGRTRPLDERVERFLKKFGGHHYIIDAEAYGLNKLDVKVAEYFNALLMHPLSKQFISAMADIKGHPMSKRRYMWKFNY